MKYSEKLIEAETLIANESYEEALKVIDIEIQMENIHTRILKAKALYGLKRYQELYHFFEGIVDCAKPTEADEWIINFNTDILSKLNCELEYEQILFLRNTVLNDTTKTNMGKSAVELQNLIDKIISGEVLCANDCYQIARGYFIKCDFVKASFYYAIFDYLSEDLNEKNELIDLLGSFYNFGEIFSLFSEMTFTDPIVFIIEKKYQFKDYYAMATVLRHYNKPVMIIEERQNSLYQNVLSSEVFVSKSLENGETDSLGILRYSLFHQTSKGEPQGATTYDLLFELMQRHDQFLYIFTEEQTLDHLKSQKVSRKHLHYLVNANVYKNQTNFTAFAYMGDYLKYISHLYGFDVESELDKPHLYAFSIVIPVRNNIETLKYTLKTCQEIDFEDYEIVVSDNSDEDHVQNYIQSLKDPKISYYRTPMCLHLTKSFEYAYIKSRGEFLIPIGADEGILKQSLNNLKKIIDEYPENKVFSWGTLSYNWPKTIDHREANKIVIGEMFSKHEKEVIQVISSMEKLLKVIRLEEPILTMPTIYQRSGMRKTFLKELLNRTGGMMFGISQDVYMGIQTLLATESYIHIKKPVVVIGNSSYSIGAQTLSTTLSEEVKKKQTKEILVSRRANAPMRYMSKTVPILPRGFTIHFIISLFNLADRGLVSQEILEQLDWIKLFEDFLRQISRISVDYEANRRLILLFANMWIPDYVEILEKKYPLDYDEIYLEFRSMKIKSIEKNFEVGIRKNGSLALDGEKFGVNNIYDAVRLIENIIN